MWHYFICKVYFITDEADKTLRARLVDSEVRLQSRDAVQKELDG